MIIFLINLIVKLTWSLFNFFFAKPQPENEMQIPDCEKCPFVDVPGGDSKPFLQAAYQSLSDGAGGENPLNMSETKMCPPEIRYVGMKQRGLDGEYTVFYGLRDSKIPMYVFHGLQPVKAIKEMAESHGLKTVKANEEMADFIIVTDKLVVALEVKAFSEGSEEVFRKRLKKSFEQLEQLRENVKMFLEAHDCKVSNDDELPLATFSLFPFAERDRHLPHIKEEDRDRVLFGDEYIKKLQTIITQDIVEKRKRQQQIRILLAWFYGIYSYENLSVRQIIDRPTGKTKVQVGGVFLSKDQLEIRNCRQNYLGIIGFPGTGKTYCLVAKLVLDITTKLEVKKKQKRDGKVEDGSRKRDEKILVIHEQKSTVKYIETLFWRALKQKFSKKDLHEVKGIVEFLTERNLYAKRESLKKSDYRLKVFFDDYLTGDSYFTGDSALLLRSLAKNIDFLWYTSYSFTPFFNISPLSFRRWKVEGDYIFDIDKYAFLDKAIRFTAHIYSLVETICKCLPEKYPGDSPYSLYDNSFGPCKTSSYRYACGTHVPGDKVKFVRVTDETEEKQKSEEELLVETVLDELREQLKKFEPKSILVIPELKYGILTKSFRKLLESRHDERFKDVTVADHWQVRGQEKECVIVVCDHVNKDFVDLQMILDASTRAVSKLVLVFSGNLADHVERDLIRDLTEERIPTVYSSAGESRESVLKEVEPLSITQLLEGDYEAFLAFSMNMLDRQGTCVTEQEKQNGLASDCNLSYSDRLLNSIPIVNDPSESFLCLKKACYFLLLIVEITDCFPRYCGDLDSDSDIDSYSYSESDSDSDIDSYSESDSDSDIDSYSDSDIDSYSDSDIERVNYLLSVLLKWMKNIEKEPGIETGVVSSSFIQYRQIVRACREDSDSIEQKAKRFMNKTQETRKLFLEIQRLCSVYEKADSFESFVADFFGSLE